MWWLRSPRSPEPRDVSDLYTQSLADSQRLRETFASIERWCLFVGYPRSGHSLVGSLLDAHPEIVVAHELDALGFLEAGFSMPQIHSLILQNDRDFTDGGRSWEGYQYAVPGQWQGRFRRLRVIGDKNGGMVSRRLRQSPELLPRLREAAGVEVRLVHVVRNPWDNIATMFRRSQFRELGQAADLYFSMCETVAALMVDARVETVRLEELVASPRDVLGRLLAFVGVEAGDDYLDACARLVWGAPRRTRGDVPWSEGDLRRVAERAAEFPYLAGYSFGG